MVGLFFALAVIVGVVVFVLVAGAFVLALAMFLAGETAVWLPVTLRQLKDEELRSGPARDWIRTYDLVMASLGFQRIALFIGDAVVRSGRAGFAWYATPGSPVLALLTTTPFGRSVTFQTGLGPERVETTTEDRPLTLLKRDKVARTIRPDVTDPARLLALHPPPPPADGEEPAEPPTKDALREEIVSSYHRVLDDAVASRLRRRHGSRTSLTLRGRVVALWRKSKEGLRRYVREFDRG
ncbi:MAG: hypothetical protein U0166_14545 [Acidobacteriota bacterium]